jgi:hypothetical protein
MSSKDNRLWLQRRMSEIKTGDAEMINDMKVKGMIIGVSHRGGGEDKATERLRNCKPGCWRENLVIEIT